MWVIFNYLPRWWQLKYFFMFTPIPGEKISNLTSLYFSDGWLNHQLVTNWDAPAKTPTVFQPNRRLLGEVLPVTQSHNQRMQKSGSSRWGHLIFFFLNCLKKQVFPTWRTGPPRSKWLVQGVISNLQLD